MSSLRGRLLLGTVLGITLFLAAGGVLIFVIVRTRVLGEVDRTLATVLRTTVPELERVLWEGRDLPFQDLPIWEEHLVQVWLGDGTVLARSAALGEANLPQPGPGERDLATRSLSMPDGTRCRAAARRFRARPGPPRPFAGAGELDPPRPPPLQPPAWGRPEEWGPPPRIEAEPPTPPPPPRWPSTGGRPPEVVVTAAHPITEELATLHQLGWLLALTWLAATLGCSAIVALVVHRSLRPLDRLREQLARLDEGSLDQRLGAGDQPRELQPVIDQLDDLVTRLAAAFARERSFAASAAHELRTPLAGLRATLELALGRDREVAGYKETARQCLDITLRMQALVERLLELARLEAAGVTRTPESAPLAQLLEEGWRPVQGLADERGLLLQAEGVTGITVTTDLPSLRRILANLLENAASYADPHTTIVLQGETTGDRLTLHVANRASAAPAEVADRAFDAFWRADQARTDTGVHAGLGLALCRRLVRHVGGTIGATFGGGLFTIILTGVPVVRPGTADDEAGGAPLSGEVPLAE